MGWLDSLLGRRVTEISPLEQGVTLEEVERLVRERRHAVFQVERSACERLAGEILAGLEDGARVAEALKGKSADAGSPHYRIGDQMRKNFATRIPPLLEGVHRPEADSEALQEFARRIFAALAESTKIVRDNRYLFHFFKEDMEAFGRAMKRSGAAADELQQILERHAPRTREYAGVEGLCREVRAYEERIRTKRERSESAKRAAEEARRETEGVRQAAAEREHALEEARARFARARSEEERLRSLLAETLQPLGRPLRKLERLVVEREHVRAIDAYATAPAKALLEEVRTKGDYPSLREVLARLRAALASGQLEVDRRLDEKIPERERAIREGGLLGPARELIRVEEENTKAADACEKLESALSAEKARLEKLEDAAKELEQAEEELRQAREAFQAKLDELSERSSRALDEKLRVELPGET